MSTTPLKRALPGTVDARKLTGQGVVLQGVYEAGQLPRFLEAVDSLVAPVDVELRFSMDEQRTRVVSGQLKAQVNTRCQRCMGTMELGIETDVSVALAWDEEEAKHLPKQYDPWIVADEGAALNELVEDELLLAMPQFSYHEEGKCQGFEGYSYGEEVADNPENPFQVLEQLKGKK